jgi:hypothetical protein
MPGNERVKKVLTGFDAIHDHIHSAGQCTLALRDYFPWYTHHTHARTTRTHARTTRTELLKLMRARAKRQVEGQR